MTALEKLIAELQVFTHYEEDAAALAAAARQEQAEQLEIARELVRACDPGTGRIVSDITRREMEPLVRDARAILAKHAPVGK